MLIACQEAPAPCRFGRVNAQLGGVAHEDKVRSYFMPERRG